jgi:AsmA protein
MLKALMTIFGLFVVMILVLVTLPFFLPINQYMDRVTADVDKKTGRELKVNGDVSFRLFPSIRLNATKVTLSNPPGFSSPNFATLDEFAVSVKLLPLLNGEIEIDRFILDHPKIAIETLADGRTNMNFDDGNKSKKNRAAMDADDRSEGDNDDDGGDTPKDGSVGKAPKHNKTSTKSSHVQISGLNGLRLVEVKLIDGAITNVDHRTGQHQSADAINVSVRLPSLDDELTVTGSLRIGDKPFDLNMGLRPFSAVLANQSAEIRAEAHAAGAKMTLTGTGQQGGSPELTGKISVDAPSVGNLLRLVNIESPAAYADLGTLALTGDLTVYATKADLKSAKLTLGPIGAEGNLSADLTPKVPDITGRLRVTGTSNVAAGVAIPMVIEGPVNAISARPDVEGLVKEKLGDPNGLVNALTKMKTPAQGEEKPDVGRVAKDLVNDLLKK